MINSLICNTDAQTTVDLHVVSPYKNISKHMQESVDTSKINITYHIVKGENYPKYNKRKSSTLKYILLDIENILSSEKETLYIESGGIVLKGWESLLDYSCSKMIGASRKKVKSSVTRNLNIPYEKYYNTKFMYLNLDQMRSKKPLIDEQNINVTINSPEDAFNKTYYNDVDPFPSYYNIALHSLIEEKKNIVEHNRIKYLDISKIDLIENYVPNITELYVKCAKLPLPPINSISTNIIAFDQQSDNEKSNVSIIINAEFCKNISKIHDTLKTIKSQSISPIEIIIFIGKNNIAEFIEKEYRIEKNNDFKINGDYFIILNAGDMIHPATLKIASPLLDQKNIIANYTTTESLQTDADFVPIRIGKGSYSKKESFENIPGWRPYFLQSDLFHNMDQILNYLTENLEISDWIKIENTLFYYISSEEPEYINYSLKKATSLETEVSIIIPIYNGANYLEECIDSIYSQTYLNKIEIIYINDCSDDDTLSVLMNYYDDERVTIINLGINLGPGIARNIGYKYARGNFVQFLDCDDIFDQHFVEEMVLAAKNNSSDIVICKSDELDDVTKTITHNDSMYRDWMCAGLSNPFTPQQMKDHLFNFVNSWAWDKLFSKKLLDDNKLFFDNTRRNQDMRFSCMAMVYSKNIFYLNKSLILHRKNIPTSQERKGVQYPYTVYEVGKSWKEELIESGMYETYYISYINRMVSALAYTLKMCKNDMDLYAEYIIRIRTEILKELDIPLEDHYYYDITKNQIKYIRHIVMDPIDKILSENRMDNDLISTIHFSRKIIKRKIDKKIVISLTTYPARISTIHIVLQSLLKQTIAADKIELWLAEEQFPQKEKELPKELLRLKNKVDIMWCDDLKPHKKYYYSFKNNPESIVITVDDDVKYRRTLVETLLNSYLHCPYAVSAMRVNKITFDKNGKISKYRKWKREHAATPMMPSMDLLATGVGGVLYPPKILSDNVFDKKTICECALFADDLWLKVNELICGVPVVLACSPKPIKLIDGTQDTGLYLDNVYDDKNDVQFKNLIEKYKEYDFNKIIHHNNYDKKRIAIKNNDDFIILLRKKYFIKLICNKIGCIHIATKIYNKIQNKMNM